MVFEGENGQGKTNLLEAIHILSVGKSTRTSSDRDLIPQYPELASNQEMYSRIAAEISTENETTQLQIDFQSSRVEQTSETQRNSLLKMIRQGRSDPMELSYWDDQLVNEGKYIIEKRSNVILKLSNIASSIHTELSGISDNLHIVYKPSIGAILKNDVTGLFYQKLSDSKVKESASAVTLTGPHRDDLTITVDEMDTSKYGSRGQARTVVLAMKLAEAEYIKFLRDKGPILLLDDVLSELDQNHRSHVLDRARQYDQTFISTADISSLGSCLGKSLTIYTISDGLIKEYNPI